MSRVSRCLLIFVFFLPFSVFAQSPIPQPTFVNPRSDLNRDHVVDELDLILLMSDWSKVTEPSPTPTNTPTFTSMPTPTATATPQIISVSGGVGLQAAIDSASPGATIRILDNLVYHEDIFIGPGKDGLTVIGAGSEPPTILAANDSISSATNPQTERRGLVSLISGLYSRYFFGDAPLPDQMGLVVEADKVLLKHLVIENDSPTVAIDLPASALTIVGNDCKVTHCILKGIDPEEGSAGEYATCLFVISGNWSELEAATIFEDLIGYFTSQGYTETVPQNTTFRNCVLTQGTTGFLSADWARLWSFWIPSEEIEPALSTDFVFDTCEWTGIGQFSVMFTSGSKNIAFYENTFQGNQGSIYIQGEDLVFENCEFLGPADRRFITQQAPSALGGESPKSHFRMCRFCGDARFHDEQIRIREGSASFEYCIFSASDDTVLNWDYNNWDSAFESFGYPEGDQHIDFDQCDLYKPEGLQPAIRLTGYDVPAPTQPAAHLLVQNSIITSEIGVQIEGRATPPEGGSWIVRNNDFIGTTAVDDQIPWMENTMMDNLFNIDPGYYDPEGCGPYSFEYYNIDLYFASTFFGPIGSTVPWTK